MQDTNWKIWGLILLIVMGVTFELMKSIERGQKNEGALAGVMVKPYSIRGGERPAQQARAALPRPQPVKVAAQSVDRATLEKFIAQNAPAATTFEEGKKKEDKGAEKKKEKEKCDPNGFKLDPKTEKPMLDANTGMPVMCKKKKKKEEEKKETPTEAKKEEPQKEESIDSTLSEAIATGEIPQPFVNNKPDDAFNSIEDWMKRLLNSPDKEETKRFIDHFQRNLVTAEIFYKITAMMLEDSRPQMKQLGVLCAGLTPSVVSFQLLAGLIKEEHSGSAPRRDAEGFLARYTDMNNLAILERVMRAQSPTYAAVLATQKLDTAAQRYLNLPGKNPPSPTPSQTATLKRNANYFQRFVALLQQLTRSSDAGVKDQAGRTLSSLQALLTHAGGTPPSPPPTAGQDDQQPTGPVASQSLEAF